MWPWTLDSKIIYHFQCGYEYRVENVSIFLGRRTNWTQQYVPTLFAGCALPDTRSFSTKVRSKQRSFSTVQQRATDVFFSTACHIQRLVSADYTDGFVCWPRLQVTRGGQHCQSISPRLSNSKVNLSWVHSTKSYTAAYWTDMIVYWINCCPLKRFRWIQLPSSSLPIFSRCFRLLAF